MSTFGTCALCGHEIFEHEVRDIWEQGVSWHLKRGRSGGGHHDKGKLWRATGAIAHGHCIDIAVRKQKAGTSIHQGGLF